MTKDEFETKVRQLKWDAIQMLYTAQSGHPGSALSIMDVLVALYYGGMLTHDPKKPRDPQRDYFLLSNGHACPGLYAVLADRGYFKKSELSKLRMLGAKAQGHPHLGTLPGIEMSAGSLGQGLSVGIGIAYAHKLRNMQNKVYVMMSDGEQEEGSTWEAVMSAPKFGLDNLIAIVDKNQFQIDGATKDVMPGLDPLAEKYRAFNWQVIEIDGHDMDAVMDALKEAKRSLRQAQGKPVVIISHTIRGQGVSYMEGSDHWHAGAISDEQFETAKQELT